jgi:hypothetical protein
MDLDQEDGDLGQPPSGQPMTISIQTPCDPPAQKKFKTDAGVAASLVSPAITPITHVQGSSVHDTSCASTGTSSPGLLETLRSQMDTGFRRRRQSFVKEVFVKHKSPDSPQESPGLSKVNLRQALSDLGMYMSASELKELFCTQDLNDDGWINENEFLMILANKVGKIQQWASTLPLAALLADCMPSNDGADPVRALSNLRSAEIQAIAACFSEGLVQLLSEEVDKLKRAYEAMERDMEDASQNNAATKYAVSRMSCGDINDFLIGLSGRIGDPFLEFEKAMKAEHCDKEDSKTLFETRNYGIRTCAHDEWQIVVQGNSSDSHTAPDASAPPVKADMRNGRSIPNIEDLLQDDVTTAASLTRAEVIAVVLYTGPMVSDTYTHTHTYIHIHTYFDA